MKQIYHYPKIIIAGIFLITVFFAFQLPDIIIDNDLYSFIGENNPVKIENDAIETIFGGSDDAMVLALESRYTSILSPENLHLIDTLTRQFETIKYVEGVTSLTNADYIEPTPEGMKVSSLIPETMQSADKTEIIKRLQSWDALYEKNLYTHDYKKTQILITITDDLEIDSLETVFKKIRTISANFSRDDLNMYIAGTPAIMATIKEKMYSDLAYLIPIVIIVVIISLYLSFHSLAGVILPLMNVLISSIWAVGLMALLKVPFTMVSIGIPIILISVGSAYGIHLLSHTYDAMAQGYNDYKRLVLKVVRKVGPAVMLAGLTTMAGFGSLMTSQIVPMRNGGLFIAIGVGIALIVALLMIPSFLILRQKPLKEIHIRSTSGKNSLVNRFLLAFYEILTKHNIRNLAFAIIILIVSLIGMRRILIDTNMIDNFEDSTPIARADAFQNEHFGGTTLLNVVIDGKEDGALLNPEVLKAMDELAYYLETEVELVGKVISFTEFVKRMNQIMNVPAEESQAEATAENDFKEQSSFSFDDEFGMDEESSFSYDDMSFGEESSFSFDEVEADSETSTTSETEVDFPSVTDAKLLELMEEALAQSGNSDLSARELLNELKRVTNTDGMAYYEIPHDPAKYPTNNRAELKNLIAQYLLLYSGNLDEFINDPLEPSISKMIVQIKSPMNADAIKVDRIITRFVENRFPDGYDVKITGTGKLANSMNRMVVTSQSSSIVSSLLIVFVIIAIYFRSFSAGFYGIATLLFSIMINFGVMGFFGIKLDLGSSMVASVAIGIGIDYTIHFLARYRQEARESNDVDVITQKTLLTSGKAILFNAVAVAAGFAVMMNSNFIPLRSLGLLVALTMLTSSFSALTILPAMIHTFNPQFLYKKR